MALLQEGQIIRDTYRVERFLGEGAFAEVYRVHHRFLGRQALKVLKAPSTSLEEVEHMLAEAILLSRIGHPNIIRVFDANVLDGPGSRFAFFTMEYVAGGNLDLFWRSYRDSLMPVDDAIEVIKQVCSGISVAHSENPPIVHRDIKPQNILVGYDGLGLRIRVSDFGLAKHVNPLTLLASSKGTLSFKPPESLVANMDSPATDVWALGTTLYVLLTDTLPFPELDSRDLADSRRLLQPLRPASIYNINVDLALDTILARCLAKDPKDRYADASRLLSDLTRWRGDRSKSCSTYTTISGDDKTALGCGPAVDLTTAERMVEEALALAQRPNSLMSAADLLEEAINNVPKLREQYESRIRLWRRGVSM